MDAERIYQALCKCPEFPCPLHETPMRPFMEPYCETCKSFILSALNSDPLYVLIHVAGGHKVTLR